MQPMQSPGNTALILDPRHLQQMMAFAELMASATVAVPQHLRGKPGDCLAVVMQATQWGMNPFAVAQKTHVSQGGALGYEGQLVSAVISGSGALEGDPTYEFIGDWNKVLGKVEERKSEKGGKYYAATYTKSDEAGLGVMVRATLRGERAPRELQVMMSQAYPRFSTQWATDPKQQICMLAIRKFTRLHKPGVLLGVYTPDELEAVPPQDMGAAEVLTPVIPEELLKASQDAADKGVQAYQKFWADAGKEKRNTLASAHDANKERALKADKDRTMENAPASKPAAAAEAKAPVENAVPKVTYAAVLDNMVKAKNEDALNVAADWIGEVEDPEQRKELSAKYDALLVTMRGAA